MITLYIDTHSDVIELILFKNENIIAEIHSDASNRHSALIMPLFDQLFKSVSISVLDIADILVINGPGSFTGVRLGVTIAKTLAFTLNIPIRVMSSILIKTVSNSEKGNIWFIESEKNGYYVGEFNDNDELLNDYFYVKKVDYESFKQNRRVIENVLLDYQKIYEYSRLLPCLNPHTVNPLYVKVIEVFK